MILYSKIIYFRFDLLGQYEINLTVADEVGNLASDTVIISVMDRLPPVANAGENITIIQGGTATFNGTGSFDNAGIINYTWRFFYNNSDQILFGCNPVFTFLHRGNYTVNLEVQDDAGFSDRDFVRVFVLVKGKTPDEEVPEADAGNNRTVYRNFTFQFDGKNSRDNVGIVNYTWKFLYNGSLIVLYGQDPTFSFDVPGNYTVTLRVRDAEGNINDDTIIITVEPKEVDIPDDDTSPTDDDIDPTEGAEDKESGSGIPLWILILIVIFTLAIIIFLVFFSWNRKENEREKSSVDDLGRVEKSEGSEIEV